MALLLELFAKGAVVVDLAVEDDANAGLLVPHRLVAGSEIDDAEAPHGEPETVLGPNSLVIRSAMHDRSVHFPQYLGALFTRKRTRDTDDSTHPNLRLILF